MGTPNDPNRVIIFDTTLRDGEQSPGCSMNLGEKLEMARALAGLGVDVIEAGFPIASPGDFESVKAIAREVTGPIICGLARCNPADIDRIVAVIKAAREEVGPSGAVMFDAHSAVPPATLIQLAAAIPNFLCQEHRTLGDGYLKRPFVARQGFVDIPKGPGLGIELDDDAVAGKIGHQWRSPESYDEDDESVVDW